jgi:Arc/MetJ family transcription regulator
MKTTIDINDELLTRAKTAARREGVTLRTVVERGLRSELAKGARGPGFKLRAVTFRGEGTAEPMSFQRMLELAYEGRGT